ncbi:contractile injection system protein, VgrG/Pvc8 family [Vreelandella janggokensis]|uniref:contractile injection system protein, VgrG/Pvc8 family n=1 Tax=Vreelandella janggokensis TaxID=370767 RepID=UPI002860ED0F|nr:contractile injection system protein, VgrG/Pvc8 family [Halomonas janggokensis]MDR5887574.1 contractile injection system protein, VgrG/Pvc8 family [Halomonas janggokensis]
MGVTPVFRITANQEDITEALRERFVSLRLTDKAGLESDEVTITLSDNDDDEPITLPPAGAELHVWLGYDDQADDMGIYVVDSLESIWPPNQLKIVAKAAPLAESESGQGSTRLMLQTKKTRSWEVGTTLGELVRSIASEHDLEPAVQEIMAGIPLPHVDQVNESDMNLLTRLALEHDGIVKPAGGTLLLARRGSSQSAGQGGEPLPTVEITPNMVTRGKMRLAKRGRAGSVVARWRDTESATTLEIAEGEGEPVQRLQTIYPDEDAARSAARSELRRGERGEQTLDLTLPGNTALMAEGRLKLSGFREGADGEWLITETVHRLDTGGFVSQAKGELPGSE